MTVSKPIIQLSGFYAIWVIEIIAFALDRTLVRRMVVHLQTSYVKEKKCFALYSPTLNCIGPSWRLLTRINICGVEKRNFHDWVTVGSLQKNDLFKFIHMTYVSVNRRRKPYKKQSIECYCSSCINKHRITVAVFIKQLMEHP